MDSAGRERFSLARLADLFGIARPHDGPPFLAVLRPDDLVVIEIAWTECISTSWARTRIAAEFWSATATPQEHLSFGSSRRRSKRTRSSRRIRTTRRYRREIRLHPRRRIPTSRSVRGWRRRAASRSPSRQGGHRFHSPSPAYWTPWRICRSASTRTHCRAEAAGSSAVRFATCWKRPSRLARQVRSTRATCSTASAPSTKARRRHRTGSSAPCSTGWRFSSQGPRPCWPRPRTACTPCEHFGSALRRVPRSSPRQRSWVAASTSFGRSGGSGRPGGTRPRSSFRRS